MKRLALILALATLPLHAQNASVTGISGAADSGFGAIDPTPPTDLKPEQIVQKFAARESIFREALNNYGFKQTVRVQTIDDSNKVDGEYQQVTEISYANDGRRLENVTFAPQNTLQRIMMSPADMSDIEHRLPFVLTTEDLPQYNVTYIGRQQVDEVDTYVFNVAPKVMEKNKRYFQGRVWVDQQELQIVLIDGKNVPDDVRRGHEDLSPPFTTYYEQVDGKYWFPTYTKGEGILNFPAQNGALTDSVHIRQIVKFTDYKQFRSNSRILFNGKDITDEKDPDAKPDDTKPKK